MSRISSSRATTAAGTSPPRVTATMPLKGPASMSRQASALAVRCSSSQVTGKFFCGVVCIRSLPQKDFWIPPVCSAPPAGAATPCRHRASRALYALVGGPCDGAAVDAPVSVRLALHLVEGQDRHAVGADHVDLLD